MAAVRTTRWSHFHHEADIGVCGHGPTPAVAFEQAAVAMTAVMTDPDLVNPDSEVHIHCEAPDMELLLVDWLNALVYETATRNMLFSRFEVSLDGLRLEATAWGEPINPRRHEPAAEIKGATYTALAVGREPDGSWFAQCVVDV